LNTKGNGVTAVQIIHYMELAYKTLCYKCVVSYLYFQYDICWFI